MNQLCRSVLGSVLAMVSMSALAQQTEERPYLSVNYDHVFSASGRASESGTGYSFGVGKAFSRYWGIEFGAFYDQFRDQASGGGKAWREYGGKVDGMFFYSRDPGFSPYFGLGVGGIETDQKTAGRGSLDPFADAGFGFFKYFSMGERDLGLRADLRYRWTDPRINFVGSFGEPVLKVGLVLPFGERPAPPPAPAKVEAPAPAPAPAAPAKPMDSDGDGVIDSLDRCPGTARGVKVDANGCPLPAPMPVVKCPQHTFGNLYFNTGKSDLSKAAQKTLDGAIAAIKAMAGQCHVQVDIAAHTDGVGNEVNNQALSLRRAQAAKKYLAEHGIASGDIAISPMGMTQPVASNKTAKGRALNRRVEIRTHVE